MYTYMCMLYVVYASSSGALLIAAVEYENVLTNFTNWIRIWCFKSDFDIESITHCQCIHVRVSHDLINYLYCLASNSLILFRTIRYFFLFFVFLGFFFPDVIRYMVEVNPSASTDATTVVSLMNLLEGCGKCPILTGSSEGYLGYRLMDSMIKEAFFLVQEGVTPIRLDRIVRERLGIRGPFDFLCNRGLKNALSYGLARTQNEFAAYKEEIARLENNPEEVFKPQPGKLYSSSYCSYFYPSPLVSWLFAFLYL